jgi:hypothetical protein
MDGKRVFDADLPRNAAAIQALAEATFLNGIVYGLKGDTRAGAHVRDFIYRWFIDPSTSMTPDLRYGQLIRGPPSQSSADSFTGVLDLRGIVKVLNAMIIVLARQSSDNQIMSETFRSSVRSWVSKYREWLRSSGPGKTAASRPK